MLYFGMKQLYEGVASVPTWDAAPWKRTYTPQLQASRGYLCMGGRQPLWHGLQPVPLAFVHIHCINSKTLAFNWLNTWIPCCTNLKVPAHSSYHKSNPVSTAVKRPQQGSDQQG